MTDRYFNGSMADLAIFSAALSASEVAKLHTAPVANLGGLSAGNTVGVNVADSIAHWRQHYFQTPENSGNATDSEDPDDDGLMNSKEYTFGTDPTQPEPVQLITSAQAGNQLTLGFMARRAKGPAMAGRAAATPWKAAPTSSRRGRLCRAT